MIFNLITIFPDVFPAYCNEGMLKRALDNKLIQINLHNLRDWTTDRHKSVDDAPYGGGAGMVMKVEPIYKALSELKSAINCQKSKVILLSAKGKKWNQQLAQEYSQLDNLTFVCGRYEGVDERVKEFVDEEISIGDYVLTGGELGALVIVDSITRLLPGVLGNEESPISESHSEPGVLEYPQYTRPEIFEAEGKQYKVPEILLSGNHAEIEKWRTKNLKKK